MDTAVSRLEAFGSRVGAAAKAVTPISAALAGVGGAALLASQQLDEAYRDIRIGTGATGEALAGLKASFETVFTSVPASAGQAAQAISDYNSYLGATGDHLEMLSTQALNLSRITDDNLGSVIKNTSQVFLDWEVATRDQADTMDRLFRVSQETGVAVSDLASYVVQAGTHARALGLDLEETAVLIGSLAKEGVGASAAMRALMRAQQNFAKEGIDAREGLIATIAEIKRLEDAGEATALALSVFGQRAGPEMAEAIRRGQFSISELTEQLKSSGDTINGLAEETKTLRERFQELSSRVLLALKPLGEEVERVFEDQIVDKLERAANALAYLIGKFNELPDPVKSVIVQVGLFVAALGPVLLIVDKVIGVIVRFRGLLQPLAALWAGLMKALGATAGSTALAIAAIVAVIAIVIRFREEIAAVLSWLNKKFDEAVMWIVDRVAAIGKAFLNLGGFIVDFFRGLASRIFNLGGDLVRALVRGIAAVIRRLPGGGGIADWLVSSFGGVPAAAARAGAAAGAAYKAAFERQIQTAPTVSFVTAPASLSGPDRGAGTAPARVAPPATTIQEIHHHHYGHVTIDARHLTEEQVFAMWRAKATERAKATGGLALRVARAF